MPPRATFVLLLLLPLLAASPAQSGDGPGWRIARPGRAWSFPEDHRAREGFQTEWWYLTGILRGEGPGAPRLGYQLTFFRVGLLPGRPQARSAWAARDLVMAHAALTDLDRGRHVFSEVLYRAVPFLGGFPEAPDPRLAWCRGPPGTREPWSLALAGEGFELRAGDRTRGVALELSTRPTRPLVMQGPGGYSRKGSGPDAASHYYGFTRLETRGRVSLDGRTHEVTGTSWMDREFASRSLGDAQVGWDWFGLRLADGRDLMLYVLRRRDGSVDHARGTLVGVDGAPRWLAREDFSVERRASWTSPASGTTYPARWRLRVPGDGLDLEVIPEVADQENRSQRVPGLDYWEGAVRLLDAGGAPAGEGFVELTGYGESRRPGL